MSSPSCKKFGLKLGVYVCPRDDHFGATTGGICKTPELQAKYDALYREQLTEVFSRYGSFARDLVRRLDGDAGRGSARPLPAPCRHLPGAAGDHPVGRQRERLCTLPVLNGISRADAVSGTSTALNSDPDGDTWLPNEVDVSMRRPNWFWSTKNDSKVLTRDQLLSIYYRSVGRGTQLCDQHSRHAHRPAARPGLCRGEELWRRGSPALRQTDRYHERAR